MLNNSQKDLLSSIIIGDGGVYKQGTSESYLIFIGHGEKQKDYLQWKIDLLKESKIFDGDLSMHTKIIKHKNGKTFLQYYTRKCGYFLKYIYDLCIVDGKKTSTELIKMMKSKRSVAIWVMDDGCVEHANRKDANGKVHRTRPNIKLCTHSFNYEEVMAIKKWFKNKYNLDSNLRIERKKEKEYYYIRFDVNSSERLYKTILKPYVYCCDSMKYKFRHCIDYYDK